MPVSLTSWPAELWANSRYDVEASQALLEQYYPSAEGAGRGITLSLVHTSEHAACAELISGQLKQLGITVNLQVLEASALAKALEQGTYEMAIASASMQLPEVNLLLWELFSGGTGQQGIVGSRNVMRYAESEVDRHIYAACTSNKDDGPSAETIAADTLVSQDMPLIPLGYECLHMLGSKHIASLTIDPAGRAQFDTARMRV